MDYDSANASSSSDEETDAERPTSKRLRREEQVGDGRDAEGMQTEDSTDLQLTTSRLKMSLFKPKLDLPEVWVSRFESAMKSRVPDITERQLASALPHLLDENERRVYYTITSKQSDWDKIKEAFCKEVETAFWQGMDSCLGLEYKDGQCNL